MDSEKKEARYVILPLKILPGRVQIESTLGRVIISSRSHRIIHDPLSSILVHILTMKAAGDARGLSGVELF